MLEYPADIVPLPAPGSAEAKVDVVIAGAGPVGLLTGCLLRQAGLEVALVDPHIFPGQASKAAVTMPRSFEQMELAGVGASLEEFGRQVSGARFCLGEGAWTAEAAGMSNPGTMSRHCPRSVGQNFVEKALVDRFIELGGQLYRAAMFTGYTANEKGVEVSVQRSAYVRPPAKLAPLPAHLAKITEATFEAKYLVGADGKQSKVRAAMGLSYEGHDYPQTFLLSDVEVPDAEVERVGFHRHSAHAVLDANSGTFLLWIHLQGTRWRTYFCQKGLTRDELTPEFLKQKWQTHIPAPGPFEPTEFKDMAFFEVACRLASAYSKGRVYLAGDAAHCHSPAGGQGMNTGLQDAANLAWKLASVIKGQAPEKLLESYEAERRPIAEWVLSTSDGMFQSMTNVSSMAFNLMRRMFFKAVFSIFPSESIPPASLFDKMAGLTINYGDVGTCRDVGAAPRGELRAGFRLPDIACVEAGAIPGARIHTLQLFNAPPYTGLRVFLVAETSRSAVTAAEIEGVASALRPVASQNKSVQLVLYTFCGAPARSRGSTCSGCAEGLSGSTAQARVPAAPQAPAVGKEALAGFHSMRCISPADPGAAVARPCGELCTKFGLRAGGRALLFVRPDGYVAVSRLGDWDATAATKALEELNLCLAA